MGLEFSFTLSWFVFPPQQPFPVFPDLKNSLAYLLKNQNFKSKISKHCSEDCESVNLG